MNPPNLKPQDDDEIGSTLPKETSGDCSGLNEWIRNRRCLLFSFVLHRMRTH